MLFIFCGLCHPSLLLHIWHTPVPTIAFPYPCLCAYLSASQIALCFYAIAASLHVNLVAVAWSFKQQVLTCQDLTCLSYCAFIYCTCVSRRALISTHHHSYMCATQYEQQWCSFESTSSSSLIRKPLDWRTQTRPPKVGKVREGGWVVWPETDQSKQPHYHISCCYFPISSLSISLQASWRTVPFTDWAWSHFPSKFCRDFTTQRRWTSTLAWETIQTV